MTITKQKAFTSTKSLLKKAEEFHGHLGPFLVIGVRMGLIGLKKLGIEKRRDSLSISLKVLPNVPYSCAVDGIQVSTRCTLGNQKLQLEHAKAIVADFKDLSNGQSVTVLLKADVLTMLKEQMIDKNLPEEEICKWAQKIAAMPEKDLFTVKKR